METQRIAVQVNAETLCGYLISLSRPGSTPIEVGEFLSIGRDPSSRLLLDDPFVSARHARLERKSGGYILRDLQSRNGTFVNGARVNEAILAPDDRLRFGESAFVFTQGPAALAPDLASKNIEWQRQLDRLCSFAASGFPILITGPSGSGKEIIARAIHAKSGRSQGAFIGINCSALSESLIESELFGHVKGSFTGASHDRKGAFEAARGGTLFLDEIGDLPLALQPKLLRALENNEIRPVGSDRSIETDVRIVAATHKNLPAQVQTGRFREDLYYRLNVCHLRPPSLRDRMEDFEDLTYAFAKQYRVRFSFAAIQKLKAHPWPGNVRELKNLVARASAYFPGKHIQPEDLDAVLEPAPIPTSENPAAIPTSASAANNSIIKEIEREMIVRRLIANRGNQRRTAQDLGMPKSTLHDRIKSYSIDVEKLTSQEPTLD